MKNNDIDGYFVAFWARESPEVYLRVTVTPSGKAIRCTTLRRCRNQPCRGFVPDHGLRRYCSVECANEAQKAHKLKWWRNVGDKERRKRIAKARLIA